VGDSSLRTAQLHEWLDRLQAGDRAAADELLRAAGARLERLARRMLRGFPNVKRWADTGDVLQGAALRLLRSLEVLRPESARAFIGLAAVHVRRELLDLARHYYGPEGIGAHHASPRPGEFERLPAGGGGDSGELGRWRAFHEAVDRLPAEEREVVGLIFYHDWTQAQVGGLLQVSARTVRRLWRSACGKLAAELGGELPHA
jgi:RNA polymerase sigma-70 factor (ECF subfamily)